MTVEMTGALPVSLMGGTAEKPTVDTPADWGAQVAEHLKLTRAAFRSLLAAQSDQTGLSVADAWRSRAVRAPHAGVEIVDGDDLGSTMHASFLIQQVVVEGMEHEQ
jgi:hypothetical protein